MSSSSQSTWPHPGFISFHEWTDRLDVHDSAFDFAVWWTVFTCRQRSETQQVSVCLSVCMSETHQLSDTAWAVVGASGWAGSRTTAT